MTAIPLLVGHPALLLSPSANSTPPQQQPSPQLGFSVNNLDMSVSPKQKILTDCVWCSRLVREYGEAEIARDIPIGKIAPPQDVANAIAFLASGLAARATGTAIDINRASCVH